MSFARRWDFSNKLTENIDQQMAYSALGPVRREKNRAFPPQYELLFTFQENTMKFSAKEELCVPTGSPLIEDLSSHEVEMILRRMSE